MGVYSSENSPFATIIILGPLFCLKFLQERAGLFSRGYGSRSRSFLGQCAGLICKVGGGAAYREALEF